MPVPTAILFVLAVLAAAVLLLGWAQDPTAPSAWEWFVTKLTEGGVWTGLFLSLLVVGYLAWRGDR